MISETQGQGELVSGPTFSPDGRWIAFSGEYAGTRQVYVIPSTGGTPRQLTYYPDVGPMPPRGGYDHLVLDWTPDGSKIMVRANRTPFAERSGKYRKASDPCRRAAHLVRGRVCRLISYLKNAS